ncbi:MAG TPA: polymer-forming cytoskeletal protein [Acidobacteriaceae bacterium]|nr:polymer-forming cytoskeletal protein [Acidobacteriaceae bacterium]
MNNTGTVIGKGICIRGEISGAEDFFLDGVIEGTITLDDNRRLTVGPNGLAQADIVTGDLVVFGRVEGSVKANSRAELKRTAAFTGDLTASRLSIEDNATMQGYVDLSETIVAVKKPVAAEMPAEMAGIEEMEPAEVEVYEQAV